MENRSAHDSRFFRLGLIAAVFFASILFFSPVLAGPADSAGGPALDPQQRTTRTPTSPKEGATDTPTRRPTKTSVPPSDTPTRVLPTDTPHEPRWLPTDTPTETPTEPPTITSTRTRTASPTRTRTSTATLTVPPTETQTPTTAPTATVTETPVPPSATPSPLPPTLTETPTPTVAPTAPAILFSLIRPSGPGGPADEYIELVNAGSKTVGLGDWVIKVSNGQGNVDSLLTIVPGTVLAPGQHLLLANVAYGKEVKPDQSYSGDIPDDGGLGLFSNPQTIVDQVGFGPGSAFRLGNPLPAPLAEGSQAYHRQSASDPQSCAQTANNAADFEVLAHALPRNQAGPQTFCAASVSANTPAASTSASFLGLTAFSGFADRYFADTIHGPASLTRSIENLITNILLALLLALLFGFSGLLLYDTLESNETYLAGKLGPLARLLKRVEDTDERLGDYLRAHHLGIVGDFVRIGIALVVFGLVYSFVDPAFSFDKPDALPLFLAVTLSIGLVNLLDDIAKLLYVRRLGGRAAVRVHGGNLVLAGALVLISRFGAITPGILSVGLGGFEGEEKGEPHKLALVGASGYGIPALVAWFALGLVPGDARGGLLWLGTLIGLIFAIALQTVFFEMLPVRGFYGEPIFRKSRVLWFLLLAFFTFLFLQTQLNPDGMFLSAFNKPNMLGLALFVVLFFLVSVAVWFYFQRRNSGAPDEKQAA